MIGPTATSPPVRPTSLAARMPGVAALRRVRLATGLVLFAYVASHLLNHAFGNVSLPAMEAVLDVVAGFWGGPPASILLYGSILAHAGLGIWALYARPRFQWSAAEALQLGLGLLLPPLLAGHVVGTKVASMLYGGGTSYASQLYVFFVAAPGIGVRQVVVLLVAWLHGCLGIWMWLRLRAGFPRAAPILLCLAVLVPTLSLLGTIQAGRQVMTLSADPDWLAENAPPAASDSPDLAARAARLDRVETGILLVFGGLVLAALCGRGVRRHLERRRGIVRVTYPDGRVARVARGTTILEASRGLGMPHAGICGGRGRCSTCRVRVFGEHGLLPRPGAAERAVLDRLGAGPQVRLACQLRPEGDVQVAPMIPPEAAFAEARRPASGAGEERFVVALFVDMRGSTRLAEERLPFDTVFLINRFLEAVARAVAREGGQPNQFLGDGMLALFGLAVPPAEAARAALAATAAIGAEVAALNALMRHDLGEPIRFGIGVGAGTAVLGEIGGHAIGHSVFTAIGDPVNVAARLQGLTKRLDVEALVAASVFETAGAPAPGEAEPVTLEGRDAPVPAHALHRARLAASA